VRAKVQAENVVQQKTRALEPRQALEHQHECDGEIVGDIAGRIRIERFIDDRFGKPLADIHFAPRPRRLHAVETEPGDDRAEIAARLFDCIVIGFVPAQIGILHDVFGLGARAKHAIGKPGQRAPMALERCDFAFGCGVHAAFVSWRRTGRVSPPTVRRAQARP
jgi:hypothetical protein